ncbi:MAG TPA: outer membrane protein transport protein [Candidatus Polarisedimenticolia bacterium]|nr:outer membrane protein transport protein [Candidatus Polarisedimenticolia bacterium]
MRTATATLVGLLVVGLAAAPAHGSGYSIYEQGAKAMANAGAFTARADDPSALFFNPAGILQLDGNRIAGGTHAIFLSGSKFDSDLSGRTFRQEDTVAWPSVLYYTHKVSDRIAWGLAFTSPFGLKTKWDRNFEGRYISRESNLAVGVLSGNVAFALGGHWTAAVGLDYARSDVRELSRNIDFSALLAPDGFTKMTGDGDDLGWNVAFRWASDGGWRWGGSYRSGMKPKIDGRIDFENIPGSPPLPGPGLFPEGDVTAIIPLPASFAGGVAYVSKAKWEGEFDVVWTDWSVFDHLRIDIRTNTLLLGDIDQMEDWHDTYSYRAGFSYHLTDRHEYRVGAYFDQNPIPNTHVRPRLPDADRTSVQVGYGYNSGKGFTLDVAYQALFFKDRRADGNPASATDPVQPGTYSNFTNLLGVTAGWKF